jgi:hypothetical protein
VAIQPGDTRLRSSLEDDRPARPGSRVPQPSSARARGTSSRSGGPLGDARGLTAAGCAVMLLVLGALFDLFVGHDLWVFFGITFIGASGLSAGRAHAEDLGATIVLPPLVYFVIAFLFTMISPRSGTHTGGSRQFAIDLGGELVFSAPILLIATVVSLAIAIARGRASAARRRARQAQRPSARPATR